MDIQTQLSLFDEITDLQTLLSTRENQWFDRKSFRIEASTLADKMIGFANADGGRILIGIEAGRVEGVTGDTKHLNELVQAALDFSTPPVRHVAKYIECVNDRGGPDKLLVLEIEASEQIHRNKRGKCYLRVGDENRRLGLTEEQELAYDKGEAIFDSSTAPGVTLDDLDMPAIEGYASRVGVSSWESLLRSRGLYACSG